MKRFWLIFYSSLIALPGLTGVVHYQLSDKKLKLSQHLAVRFPPRLYLQYLNNRLQVDLLGSRNLGNVHMGKDQWLFYMTRTDGNANNDFWAIPATGVASRLSSYVQKNVEHPFCLNAAYLFLSTPNKESIYPEQTLYPFISLIPRDRGNYQEVYNALLARFPNNVVDVAPALRENKTDGNTYFPRDSHWTSWGAYWAHTEILRKAGELLHTTFTPRKVIGFETQKREDDLNLMIKEWGFKDSHSEAQKVRLEQPDVVDAAVSEENYKVYLNPKGQKTLLFIGDSFRVGLEEYLPQYFQKTIFVHRNDKGALRRAIQENGSPDLIIDQFAERYLGSQRSYECIPLN